MPVYENVVFISYAWGGDREEIVNEIDKTLQKRGIKIIRDKRDLGYRSSIKEFMERIGQGNCVIVVVSDKYLRSPNCMFELVEIADNKQFHDRIFPVILGDANIYDPVKRIEYIRHWELKRAELAEAIKTLDPANLQGIREEMDTYDRIRTKVSELTSILKDMNTLTPDMHRDSDFSELYDAIVRRVDKNQAGLAATKDLLPKTSMGLTMGPNSSKETDLDCYRFIKIDAQEAPYAFYIGKYPVTNAQYKRFLTSPDFLSESIWNGFSKFNEACIKIGEWEKEGWDWLKSKPNGPEHNPRYWDDTNFGIAKLDNPIVGITWYEANAYCKWLKRYWDGSPEERANPGLQPRQIRLPLESEWVAAAGGEIPKDRYPWDKDGVVTKNDKDIALRANINNNVGYTTPVNAYMRGARILSSGATIMDLAGNVWEWQSNFYNKEHKGMALRGGSWKHYPYSARVSYHYPYSPGDRLDDVGFRVVVI